MMNAPNSPGLESGLMSGTSPTHFSPFHLMPAREGSQGLPSLSAEARLYMTRRLAGHEKPQVWNIPRPLGSALDRRAGLFSGSLKHPPQGPVPPRVGACSPGRARPANARPAGLSGVGLF